MHYIFFISTSEVRKRSFRKTLSVPSAECEKCTVPVRKSRTLSDADMKSESMSYQKVNSFYCNFVVVSHQKGKYGITSIVGEKV